MSTNQTTKSANLSAIDEQLFTELAPEQAAIVEGGLQVQLTQLECLQAGADSDSSDEVYVKYNDVAANAVNGPSVNFGSPTSMSAGSIKNISSLGGSGNQVIVTLFDKDGSNQANADALGGFLVSSSGSNQKVTVAANGSRYKVTFNAF